MRGWRGSPSLSTRSIFSGVWLLALVFLAMPVASANAGLLEAVTTPVNEAVAPVGKTVESVAAPVTAPPPKPVPPVKVPQVKLPAAPVPKVPSADSVTESGGGGDPSAAAAEVTDKTVEAATDAAREVTSGVSGEAAEATAALGAETASATPVDETPVATPANEDQTAKDAGAGRTAPPAAEVKREISENAPANPRKPFLHVWPAVALTVFNGPLGGFLDRWSADALGLSQEGDASGPAARTVGPQPAGGQVEVSDSSPASSPFDWVSRESAIPVLIFFLLVASAVAVVLAGFRRETDLFSHHGGRRRR